MLSPKPTHETYAGQAIYNPVTLALYDIVVLGLSNRLIFAANVLRDCSLGLAVWIFGITTSGATRSTGAIRARAGDEGEAADRPRYCRQSEPHPQRQSP